MENSRRRAERAGRKGQEASEREGEVGARMTKMSQHGTAMSRPLREIPHICRSSSLSLSSPTHTTRGAAGGGGRGGGAGQGSEYGCVVDVVTGSQLNYALDVIVTPPGPDLPSPHPQPSPSPHEQKNKTQKGNRGRRR